MKKEKNGKYGLLKVLGISFLVFAVLTWIIPTGTYSGSTFTAGETDPVGLYGLFISPLYSFGIFVQYIVVFLAIGGLYGVMNKTGVYSKLVKGISTKFENKKTLFLIITMIFFILFTSLVGSQVALFVFVPLLIAILMTLGYDKLTVLAATVGSILVGVIGSTYGTGVVFKSFLNMDANNGIIYKVIFLVLVSTLYIFFILGKNKLLKKEEVIIEEKPKRGRKKKEEVVLEKKEDKAKKIDIPLYEVSKKDNNKSVIPLIVILSLLALILFGGMFNWYYTFGLEFFDKIYESIMTFEIGGVAIFAKIFGDVPQFGYFGNYDLTAILLIISALVAWIYGIKLNEFVDSFKDGAKKMLLPAIYVMFASIIFAVMVNSSANISATITNFLFGLVKEFNVLVVSVVGLVGSFFYNDFPYLINGIYGPLSSYDATIYPIMSIIFNATYGIAMLILPVSITLIAGLKYMEVSYKDWAKYIWKFLLCALILVIIFALIVLAII